MNIHIQIQWPNYFSVYVVPDLTTSFCDEAVHLKTACELHQWCRAKSDEIDLCHFEAQNASAGVKKRLTDVF